MPASGRGVSILPSSLRLRQVDDRNRGVFLVLGVEPLAVRRDDQAMAVGRAGIDRLDHFVGLAVDHRDHRAVLAGDVDQAVGPELERMRGDIGPQIDGGDMRALVQIENAEMMLRVGIAAVNAVAEDRHIGEAGFRHDEQFVHGSRKAVEHDLGRIGRGIEKQDFCPHLVDRDHPMVRVSHRFFLRASADNFSAGPGGITRRDSDSSRPARRAIARRCPRTRRGRC